MNEKANNLLGGKRRIFWFGLALMLLAIAGFGWQFGRTREPKFEGQPLSYWLEGYLNGSAYGPAEADRAMQAIGTNAIPTLVDLLHVRDSRLKLYLLALLQRQNFVQITNVPAEHLNDKAIRGFEKLRAHPDVVLPALLKCLHDPVADVRVNAAHSLGTYGVIGDVARPAIPELRAALNDPDWRVSSWSKWALRQIEGEATNNLSVIYVPTNQSNPTNPSRF